MDDDAGAMSAWYVFGSLGLYPLVPGRPEWTVAAPLVERATLTLADGRVLVIQKNGVRAPTITVDGVPQGKRPLTF